MQDDHRVMPVRRRCVSTTESGLFDSGPAMPNNRMLEHYLLVSYSTHQPFSQGHLPSGTSTVGGAPTYPGHEYPIRLTSRRQVHQRAWSPTRSSSLRRRRQRVHSIVWVADRMGWREPSNIATGDRFLLLFSHQGQIPIEGSK